jgi:hypothetical protein
MVKQLKRAFLSNSRLIKCPRSSLKKILCEWQTMAKTPLRVNWSGSLSAYALPPTAIGSYSV